MAIKIIFVIDNLDVGGPQKSLLALLDKIDYSIFNVDVLSLHGEGQLSNKYNKNATIIKPGELLEAILLPVKKPLWALKTFLKYKKIRLFVSAFYSMVKFTIFKCNMNQERQKLWKKYHRFIPSVYEQYDLAFGILGLSTYCIIDVIKANKKFHWIRSDPRFLRLDESIEAEYFKQLDGVLSVSNECANIFVNMYPFMKDKVQVFYNYIPINFYKNYPVDTSVFDHSNDNTKIITVSRLSPHKGIELVLEVCKELVRRNNNFTWFILGDGPNYKKYNNICNQYKLSNYIKFLGFQFNTIGYISNADIFVHLSESEGKSNAVDEAIYACKPIIITNYPTVKEQIINGYNGIICSFNISEIADTIEKVMKSSDLREKLIANCNNINSNELDANSFILNLI